MPLILHVINVDRQTQGRRSHHVGISTVLSVAVDDDAENSAAGCSTARNLCPLPPPSSDVAKRLECGAWLDHGSARR